jgi:LPS-assembly protein
VLRPSAATAALATLALALPAWPQSTFIAPSPQGPVEVEADQIVYQWEAQVIRLQGHVVVRREGALLRAGSGSLDRAHGILKLEGGVLGVQARQVFLADAAVVDLNARSAELTKAVLFLKEHPANPDAPRAGANALTLHGSRVRQLPGGGYAAEHVTLTPCDCAGDPDYELIADSAEIEGDRAHLHGVDLRFLRATIPLFPLSLPLTSRQSGLLAPQFGFGPSIGFTLVQPVFFTLGQSNDVTITPGFYTGGTNHVHPAQPGVRSVKGPRLGLEWRYAPVQGTSGSVALDLYDDLDQHDSVATPSAFEGERGTSAGRGFGGVRGLAHFDHRSEGEPGVFAVQGVLATDAMAARDPQPNALESLQDFLRTDLGAWRARGPLTLGLDATILQDVRLDQAAGPDPLRPPTDRRLFGPERRSTMQRLPGAFAQLAPTTVGPGTFELEASVVQFQRLVGPDAEERTTGWSPTDLNASPQRSALGYDGSRAPALRLDVSPRLGFSAPRTFPLDLRLELGARADGWIVEGFSDRNRSRAYAIAGAQAGLPLERKFGDLLHRIEPAIAVRALSKPLQSGGPPLGDLTDAGGGTFASAPDAAQQGIAGQLPDGTFLGVPAARRAYDEIDFAAPVSGAVEATASLSQSLWAKRGPVPGRIFQFDLKQDALLWARGARARVGEGSAVAGLQFGLGSVGTSVRYDWASRALSAFSAGGGLRDGRGDELHGGVSFLRGASSERLRAGIDELFSAARFSLPPTPLAGTAGAGASGPLFLGLRLAYNLGYTFSAPESFVNWAHSAALSYETPCRCATFQVALAYNFHDAHLIGSTFSFRFDLKSIGSFSTF